MRTLRRPDLPEIIQANRQQGDDALRFSQDITYIPIMYPPFGSTNVTWGIQYVSCAQTTYQTAFQFQVFSGLMGCLNLQAWIQPVTGGATAYFQFEDGAVTVWTENAAASTTFSKSFPSWASTGTLRFQIKCTAGTVRARVNCIFLSSRPFYSY